MVQQHTASKTSNTIWTPISEECFQKAVRGVFSASRQTAGVFRVYNSRPQANQTTSPALPFEIESQLTQDFAFIAAYEEGANAVSAASITPQATGRGMAINIASNSGVVASVQTSFEEISRVLERCAQKELCSTDCIEELFDLVVKLDRSRIISRLRSELWEPPDAFKTRPPSLCACLHRMLQAVSRASPGRRTDLEPISRKVRSLSSLVAVADGGGFSSIHENLKGVLRAAGSLKGSDVSLEQFLDRKTIKTTDVDKKAIRALDKLANYWHLCRRLCRLAASKRYRSLFAPLYFEFVKNYSKHKINGINRYVHAEVQLTIFHRQRKDSPDPRAIGTSKAACYLCDLFLSYHPQYTISATHGVLYECWTIPDLASYNVDDKRELRNIIGAMFKKLAIWTSLLSHPHTMFPVQSGIYQPPYVPSLTATTTSLSDATIKENFLEAPTYFGVDDGHVCENELEEQNAPSYAPHQSQTNIDIAPGLSATRPNVAESDAAGSTEAQRLHGASEQREVPEGTDGGPSAPTVARNAPERTGFPITLKPTKIKAQGHVAGSAPGKSRMPVTAPIEAGDIAGYLGGVSKRDSKQQIRERSHRKSHRTQSGQYILQGQEVLRIRRSDDNRGTMEKKSRTQSEKRSRRQSEKKDRNRKRKRRTIHHSQREKSPRPRLLRILDHILVAFCGLRRH